MAIILHNLESSRAQRVLWLLEELDAPYELRTYRRDPHSRRGPPEIRAVHPLGKSPTIEVDGQALAETGAIFEYLIDTVGQGRLRPPAGSPERTRFTFWLHYGEGSAMQNLVLRYAFNAIVEMTPPSARDVVKDTIAKLDAAMVEPSVQTHMNYWESELGRSKFIAGDAFTAADVMMGFAAIAAARLWNAEEGRPRLKAWLDALRARPAYQRTLEKARAEPGKLTASPA